jgi:hypothetical protein
MVDNYLPKEVLLIDSSIFIKYILKTFKEPKIKSTKKDKIFTEENSKTVLSKLRTLNIRENQEKMLDIIDSCLDNNKLTLIEAPTGL